MPDTWTISVAGRSYGPYSQAQMQAFAGEGRLAPHSLVARASDEQFRPAAQDPELAVLFQPAQPAPVPAQAAAPAAARAQIFFTADSDDEPQGFGRSEAETTPGERAHYLIVADMKSRSIAGLEEEIFNLGPAYPIMPQAWLVASEMPINAIRNALVQKLGKLDMLFVIDATHNKAAWFNFGPEADTRIRRIWQKPSDAAQTRRAG